MKVTKERFEEINERDSPYYAGFIWRFEERDQAFLARQYEANIAKASFINYFVQKEGTWNERPLNTIHYPNSLFSRAVQHLLQNARVRRVEVLLPREGYTQVRIQNAVSKRTPYDTNKPNFALNMACLCLPGFIYGMIFGPLQDPFHFGIGGFLLYTYLATPFMSLFVLLFGRSRLAKSAAWWALLGFILPFLALGIVFHYVPPTPTPGHP